MLTPTLSKTKPKCQHLAVLTSGGDAPGMNAAIRAIVRYGFARKISVSGVARGYSGLLEGRIELMGLSSVANIIQRGGTLLKSDRCEAFFRKSVRKKAVDRLRQDGIDGLIVIGGDGSFRGAHLMGKENRFPVVGVPGTIDNDIPETEVTIGFDTAINTALDAIDRIRDTATSHERIFLIEVMGRSSGFIASRVAIAGGAESVVLPEKAPSVSSIVATIKRGMKRGKRSSIIVVAEGKRPGAATRLSDQLERQGFVSRVCILGHTQRGGSPSATDRYLATMMGASAVDALASGKRDLMVGVHQNRVRFVPFSRIVRKKKLFREEVAELARLLAS